MSQEEPVDLTEDLTTAAPDDLVCLEAPLGADDETLPKAQEKKKSFRMSAKQFILTFPQCDVKKEVAVERLQQKWKEELKGYIVCEEAHKDGTPHLHVFLLFNQRKNFKASNCFDFIGGKHGSYEVARSVRGSVEYVTKGGNYIVEGLDVEAIKKKKAQKNETYAKMLMDGKTLSELNEVDPGYVMMNKRKLEEYQTWVECESEKKRKLEWVPPKLDGLTGANLKIAEWICKNIRQPRPFKSPQLYIHGPRNVGKTSLIVWLEKYLSVYHIPMGEEYYCLYSDSHDLIVMDEFKGQKTIQWLNSFIQGNPFNIRKKGLQSMKRKNLPCIFLSNYSLQEVYSKANQDGRLSTLECRFECVEVDTFIDFYHDKTDLV